MLLLDTCALLWLAAKPDELTAPARAAIAAAPAALCVSAISAFEIGLKHRKGRLDLGLPAEEWWTRAIAHHGLRIVPVSDGIALASTALPPHHADPCDRIILATAHAIGAPIVTADPLFRRYPGTAILW